MKKYTFFLIILSILNSCGDKKKNDRDRFFLRGNVALSDREYDEAIRFYSESIKIDPEFAMAFNNRGIANYEDDDLVAAVSDYSQALLINPEFTDAYFNRANEFSQLGDLNSAIDDYTRSIQLNISADAITNRAFAYLKQQRFEQAKKDIDWAIKVQPNYAQAYFLQGLLLNALNDTDAACKTLKKAISLGSRNAQIAHEQLCKPKQ